MADSHVLSALKEKRARLAGELQVTKLRAKASARDVCGDVLSGMLGGIGNGWTTARGYLIASRPSDIVQVIVQPMLSSLILPPYFCHVRIEVTGCRH